MLKDTRIYSLPRWPITRWLVDAGPDVPPDIRHPACVDCKPVCIDPRLRRRRYQHRAGCLGHRRAAAARTVHHLVSARNRCVCGARDRAGRVTTCGGSGQADANGTYVLLGLCWAFSVGYGAFISLVSGDWVAATLACVSSAAMVGGTCFRNFGAPRMSAAMIVLSLGPVALGAIFAGEPIIWLTVIQTPLYLVAMSMAGYRLNANLVATMRAEQNAAPIMMRSPAC